MTILYITLWLLSGFLAAWVMQRFLDGGRFNYNLLPVIVLSLLGVFSLVVALFMSVIKAVPVLYNELSNITVFKAKEPK